MYKSIDLKGKKVRYNLLLSKRAKRARLSVYCGGEFSVTIPRYYQETTAEKFIREKAVWILGKLKYFERFKNKPYLLRGTRRDYLKYKASALVLIRRKLAYLNGFYGFKIGRVSIKNQKTRWGSCSRKGNLNFNYKIILAPEYIADYIIAHELCHLMEFNHSKDFWRLVARTVPDYKKVINEIRL